MSRAVFFLLLGVGACTDAPQGSEAESALAPEWSLSPQPVVTVGADESREGHILTGVRLGALPDDGIVLLDAQSQELRAFSEGGELRWVAGGRGDGPGDFQDVQAFRRTASGEFVVTDGRLQKVVTLGPDGEFLGSRSVAPQGTFVMGAGAPMADGSVWLPVRGEATTGGPSPGVHVLSGDLGFSLAGPDTVRHVAEFPNSEMWWINEGGTHRFDPLPFGAVSLRASGNQIAVFGNGRIPVQVSDTAGRVTSFPSPFARAPVTDSMKRLFLKADVPNRELNEEVFRRVELPDSAISYDQLHVDALDRIWIRQFRVGPGPRQWMVSTSEGDLLGSLALPEDAEVLDANADRVLVRRVSPLDVSFAEVWAVQIESTAPPSN